MTASTLLAALIAASTTTNGVITVGDTQPFDQVRLYQNPANSTVLTNQSSDGSIDTSTTALVITGSTAPTGLVFEPNLSVLRNVTSDIKLLVDTSVELTLTVNLAGSLTEMTVEAGKTAVLTLALIAGIPMIVGSHGFFPVATDGNGAGSGLQFVATGAVETVDGEYQRFTHDGTHTASIVHEGDTYLFPVWHADLPPHSSSAFQVAFKLPQGAVDVYIANAEFSDVFFAEETPFNRIALELRSEDRQGTPSSGINVIDHATPANSVYASLDPMPAGSLIVLNVFGNSIDYVSPVGNGSLPIPANFFSTAPNVVAYAYPDDLGGSVPALSIKIVEADEA